MFHTRTSLLHWQLLTRDTDTHFVMVCSIICCIIYIYIYYLYAWYPSDTHPYHIYHWYIQWLLYFTVALAFYPFNGTAIIATTLSTTLCNSLTTKQWDPLIFIRTIKQSHDVTIGLVTNSQWWAITSSRFSCPVCITR